MDESKTWYDPTSPNYYHTYIVTAILALLAFPVSSIKNLSGLRYLTIFSVSAIIYIIIVRSHLFLKTKTRQRLLFVKLHLCIPSIKQLQRVILNLNTSSSVGIQSLVGPFVLLLTLVTLTSSQSLLNFNLPWKKEPIR